jgi:transcriptional regulator with PAS, ATPase and Fis domain
MWMIKTFKTKLWDILKEKEVSLAMLYDREGEILWHKGRAINGKTIDDGEGFCKSYVHKSLESGDRIDTENVVVTSSEKVLSKSAQRLLVKSIIIQPLDNRFFLYIDSGTKDFFNDTEREIFKLLGELLKESIKKIRKGEDNRAGISGTSEAIKNIRELVLKYSLEEEPVLIRGETGSGKTHIAGLIHRYSGRSGKFIVVDTPTINENLFESEIFGHKKGAFTGAVSDKSGLVDVAREGTLFFDEIAEVPISFQAKLLRFIDTKKYRVLGSTAERTADVRIVAATNKDLVKAIEKKEFRDDLYYRLNVLDILIPPLRHRKEDIKSAIIERRSNLKGKEIGNGFWEAVYNHEWPGNYRELFTVLKRAGILCSSPIKGEDIRKIIEEKSTNHSPKKMDKNDKMKQIQRELLEGKSFWEAVWKKFINRDLNRDEVKQLLTDGFVKSEFKLKKLSTALNIKNNEFKKFIATIHKYNIHPGK